VGSVFLGHPVLGNVLFAFSSSFCEHVCFTQHISLAMFFVQPIAG